MAAPSRLTDDLRRQIERDLASGVSQAATAQRAGVSPRSLRRWLHDGRINPPPSPPVPAPDAEPVPRRQRLARAEPGLVAAIVAASERGSWQAAAWLLERAFPEHWAKREPGSLPGPPDAFAELDELAARRRNPAKRP
jgi:hypothetical protein